jgi:hypothetical protein
MLGVAARNVRGYPATEHIVPSDAAYVGKNHLIRSDSCWLKLYANHRRHVRSAVTLAYLWRTLRDL